VWPAASHGPNLLPTSTSLVEAAAALLSLVLALSAVVNTTGGDYPRPDQVQQATIEAAHLVHADSPWATQSVSDHLRVQAPVEQAIESGSGLARAPADEPPQSPIRIEGTDRPETLRDLSAAVHPDRIHAPPFLS
jgi:hypothetical protein